MKEKTAYLGLGSNLGDRVKNMRDALKFLERQDDLQITGVSSLYETEPVGYLDQGLFLNAAVEIETTLTPHSLLSIIQAAEKKLKRRRIIKWGPRTIDIDILLYDNLKMDSQELNIPHPLMVERPFVLVPLCEIAPDALTPDGISVREMSESLGEKDVLKRLPDRYWYKDSAI